ncbi:MAG: chorismate-binding protein [Bacteroidota bacterium]
MSEKLLLESQFKKLSKSEKINAFYQAATENGLPVAIWSLPKSNEFYLLISFSKSALKGSIELENEKPGFLFSPFSNEDGSQNYFLNADLLYHTQTDVLSINPAIAIEKQQMVDELLDKINNGNFGKLEKDTSPIAFQKSKDYISIVNNGINKIKAGQYDKLVLSRNKRIQLSDNFDPIEKLWKLRSSYDSAFCYLLSTKEFGNWMAATPETLITLNADTFETVSLAGTSRLEPGESLNNVSWTQKEIEEQAMVSRYIINSFKKIRLREFKETGPRTIKAGNLAHLKTTFSVKYQEINFPELGTVMLKLLHPTSAVCGMPLEAARNFINTFEGFDRSLFAGYLGPVNIADSTNIFVNLRTMRFNQSEAVLYAGAGITEDSVAEKELIETELKMKTLLNVIES